MAMLSRFKWLTLLECTNITLKKFNNSKFIRVQLLESIYKSVNTEIFLKSKYKGGSISVIKRYWKRESSLVYSN